MSDFYIGYLPKAPADIAKFIRRIVTLLLSTAALLAGLFALSQERFSPAVFEWQNERDFRGIIEERPYPTLLVEDPVRSLQSDRYSRYLLVGLGKHGAALDVAGFDGKSVHLRGKLIYRAGSTMIEIMPNSIVAEGTIHPSPEPIVGDVVSIHGQIVDSKCFSGVMNPGEGKVHRDCAVRCLSGGVPPLLLENAPSDRLILLTSPVGEPLPKSTFLDRVAEPVIAKGRLVTRGDRLELRVESIVREQ